ncbi:MAG: S41 family peptidase [Bacteroidales bacterium]|jgi:carboxyl-terminal processing protease
MNDNKKLQIYLPVLLAFAIIIGIVIGSNFLNFGKSSSKNIFSFEKNKSNKFNDILNIIDEYYVDSVNKNKLTEIAVADLLQNLDPHSYYIPASELKKTNEMLTGSFEGIGIEFNIQKDTVIVISTITGGPAESLGVKPGDRIIKINNINAAGIKITNKEVFSKLRGKKGTKVTISVLRNGYNKLVDFTIVRDKIPEKSVDIAFMFDKQTGYIKLSKFSATTFNEMKTAIEKLKNKNIKKLILDLRGNGGGYLDIAVKIADEFLYEGKLIVYTEGRNRPRTDYYATGKGELEDTKIIVLIDEWSASASEILAGAIQDNDRGLVIGRRSFGKGLVQEQMELQDGSALRLTIARYHTPTGRCIQRPYGANTSDYYNDFFKQYTEDEDTSGAPKKSTHPDSLKYKTPKGKIVYGGGGITPDITVRNDTGKSVKYFFDVANKGLINQFAFDYADRNRKELNKKYKSETFNNNFIVTDEMYKNFIEFASKKGIGKNIDNSKISETMIKTYLKAFIGRLIFNNESFYPVILKVDKTFLKAVEEIKKL